MTDFIAELGPLALASRFRRLSERMMRQCEEVYRARGFDFQPGWFPLVRLLWTRGPCSPSEATRVLGVTPASISQVVRELERRGFVSSRKDGSDERRRILDLTRKGTRLAGELDPLWEEIRRRAEAILADTGFDLDVLALVEHAFDRGALREGVGVAEPRPSGEAPTIRTARLLLRPFATADAEVLRSLAADPEVADHMISLPRPLARRQLENWIRSHRVESAQGSAFHFAIELPDVKPLAGAVELRDVDTEHLQAELSFWVGRPWWGRGFATEAAKDVIHFAFENLGMNRVYAHHMVRNPASGRVLAKLGMQREGLLRQRVLKNGAFEDVVLCALVREDWAGLPLRGSR